MLMFSADDANNNYLVHYLQQLLIAYNQTRFETVTISNYHDKLINNYKYLCNATAGHMHIFPDVRLPYEPPGSLPPDGSPGTCNAYLSHLTSTLDRFLWVINFLARNGFLVQINSQLEQDPSLLEDRSAWAEVRPSTGPYGLV